MSTNFWELLQQHQGDLTKSGRTVAEYLVQHAAEAQYLSISSLARECQVAEATVFRFCRALGFEGYHEMRIALAQANATGVLVNQQEPAPDADTATLCEHASALFMTAINGTQNALSPQAASAPAAPRIPAAFRKERREMQFFMVDSPCSSSSIRGGSYSVLLVAAARVRSRCL